MLVSIVFYQAEKFDESHVIKIFDSYKKAEEYINSNESMPDENEDGYTNDDKLDPDCLYIEEYNVE